MMGNQLELFPFKSSKVKVLYVNKLELTQHTNKLFVMSLIQCHYDYACCI